MTDISNAGQHFNLKESLSNYYYESLLFKKKDVKIVTFGQGRHYMVDVCTPLRQKLSNSSM
jgi:hypothetical protein